MIMRFCRRTVDMISLMLGHCWPISIHKETYRAKEAVLLFNRCCAHVQLRQEWNEIYTSSALQQCILDMIRRLSWHIRYIRLTHLPIVLLRGILLLFACCKSQSQTNGCNHLLQRWICLKQLFFSLKMEIGICASSRRRLRWTCVDTRRWQAHEWYLNCIQPYEIGQLIFTRAADYS